MIVSENSLKYFRNNLMVLNAFNHSDNVLEKN